MAPRKRKDEDKLPHGDKAKRTTKRPIKRPAFRNYAKRRKAGDLHTVPSFCASNAISESTYYKLKRRGLQPREIVIDNITRITEEAERDWRAEREAETMAKRQQGPKPVAQQVGREDEQRERAAEAAAE